MSRTEYHRYMFYVCAETGRPVEAEYHRLECASADLNERLERYSIIHPWFWVLLVRSYRLDAQLLDAYLRYQNLYRELP